MWQKLKNNYHLLRAAGASIRFQFPARHLTIIGVTGTDGKTTTSSLIYHVLKTAGKKVSLISTVSAMIGDKELDTGLHVTTPDGYAMQRYLKKVKEAGSEYVVLEVTSHALDQNRVYAIPFAIGVVTNVTHEHLDYHKTYENYVRTKMKLLEIAKGAVINKDDSSYTFFKENLQKDPANIVTYGFGKDAQVNPEKFPFTLDLSGEFNQYNALAAIAVSGILNIPGEAVAKALSTFKPPKGRMEIVYAKDFTVMIDFAHTPNAITQLLKAVKADMKNGRIIHVFGSAGKRDTSKRQSMGKASAMYADIIILTAEDPRGEAVSAINNEIKQGISGHAQVLEIENRKEAINKAIALAQNGDWVVITGKGHEQSLNLTGKELPWNEHEVVVEALALKKK